jgi:hypothetical protein
MIKTRRILPLLGLLAIAIAAPLAAIGAAEAVESESAKSSDTVNLPLLVLVNRLELTDEQMTTLHGLLRGVLDDREAAKSAHESLQAAFEEEMVAFDGTSEELEALLEAHRTEIEALREEHGGSLEDVLDVIKETLTFEQGQLLQAALPMLLTEREAEQGALGTLMGQSSRGGRCSRAMPSFGGAERPRLGRGGDQRMDRGRSFGPMLAQRDGARGMRGASGPGPGLLKEIVEILELKML